MLFSFHRLHVFLFACSSKTSARVFARLRAGGVSRTQIYGKHFRITMLKIFHSARSRLGQAVGRKAFGSKTSQLIEKDSEETIPRRFVCFVFLLSQSGGFHKQGPAFRPFQTASIKFSTLSQLDSRVPVDLNVPPPRFNEALSSPFASHQSAAPPPASHCHLNHQIFYCAGIIYYIEPCTGLGYVPAAIMWNIQGCFCFPILLVAEHNNVP